MFHMNTIGVGLIIRNEQDNLAKFLDQCKIFADQICIVDTGSTDHSRKVAVDWSKANKVRVDYIDARVKVSESINGEWLIRDFAAARNIYVQYLDDLVDYIFTASVGNIFLEPHKIRDVVKTNEKVYGFTITRGSARFTHHRLFKTKLGLRYFGAVHEFLNAYSVLPKIPHSGLVISHECGNASSQESSIKRNLRILEREYKLRPTSRTLFYYGIALRDCRRFKEAVAIFNQYLRQPGTYLDERIFAFYYAMRCLSTYDRDEAIRLGYKGLAVDRRFSEIPMYMSYLYLDKKEYHKALAFALLAYQKPPASDMFLELCMYKEEPLAMIKRIQDLKVV